MEQAVIITNPNDWKVIQNKVQRYYWGNDFCPDLLTWSKEEKQLFLRFIRDQKLSLLFPPSNTRGLKKIQTFLKDIPSSLWDEVIVNDFGVLNFISKKFENKKIIAGRFLTRFFVEGRKNYFFNDFGIKTIEFDYLKSDFPVLRKFLGIQKYYSGENFNEFKGYQVHLYYPYTTLHLSRYCPIRGVIGHGTINWNSDCQTQDCLSIPCLKSKSFFFKDILLKYNGRFLRQKKITTKNLKKEGVKRIIIQSF